MPVTPENVFVDYVEWLEVYETVKKTCDFNQAIQFLQQHPGTANNRKDSLQGNTLLHQAAYWGVGKSIISLLKEHGADPNLRNYDGNTPLDMARPEKREMIQALLLEVYGADDAAARISLLRAAKQGDLAAMMSQLRQRPYLINTQGHTGWSVVHQVAYHAPGRNLFQLLASIGACMELRTHDGRSPSDILAANFPGSTILIPNTLVKTLAPGMQVWIHSAAGSRAQGVLSAINHEVAEVEVDGHRQSVPYWRVFPVVAVPSQGEADEVVGSICVICDSPVPPSWKVSSECADGHPMCSDCLASFLWSQFTSSRLPMQCGICAATVDPEVRTLPVFRAMGRCWPPGSTAGHAVTGMTFAEFTENVREQILAKNTTHDNTFKLRLLQECGLAPRIEYCGVTDCPAMRACPHCGVIIEYEARCKHMTCVCRHQFCFLCLGSQDQHAGNTWNISVRCPLAPRQTEIPALPAS